MKRTNKYHVWYGYWDPVYHACCDAYLEVEADTKDIAEAKAKDALRGITGVQIRMAERVA